MTRYFFLSILCLCLISNCVHCQNIHEMAKTGDLEKVKDLLKNFPGFIDSVDEVGYTPLHWALIRAKWNVAVYLIEGGANLNIQGIEGGTPLHCAANQDNTEIIQLLIKRGAEIEVKNAWGNSPLCLASERGCEKTVKALIALGANVHTASDEGWTPLHYACQGGHSGVQKVLLATEASNAVKDKWGKTPDEYILQRPSSIEMNNGHFVEYVGDYNMGTAGLTSFMMKNGQLMMEDFAVDAIYPIAFDIFYHSREPWMIRFYRNYEGAIDKVVIDVQRSTMIGKKVQSKTEVIEKPRLGIKSRPLNPGDVSDEAIKILFFDLKANSNALLVTFVQENSPSQRAGIKVNDIILEFNNTKIQEPGDLLRLLFDLTQDSQAMVKIFRDSKVILLDVKFFQ